MTASVPRATVAPYGPFAAGIVYAGVIRGTLFFLSFGVIAPAFGIDNMVIDTACALLLAAGTLVVLTTAGSPASRRTALFAHGLGWVYLADNLIYAATVSTFYATSTEIDGGRWFGGAIAALQIPLLILSVMIVRRTARAVRKPIRVTS